MAEKRKKHLVEIALVGVENTSDFINFLNQKCNSHTVEGWYDTALVIRTGSDRIELSCREKFIGIAVINAVFDYAYLPKNCSVETTRSKLGRVSRSSKTRLKILVRKANDEWEEIPPGKYAEYAQARDRGHDSAVFVEIGMFGEELLQCHPTQKE